MIEELVYQLNDVPQILLWHVCMKQLGIYFYWMSRLDAEKMALFSHLSPEIDLDMLVLFTSPEEKHAFVRFLFSWVKSISSDDDSDLIAQALVTNGHPVWFTGEQSLPTVRPNVISPAEKLKDHLELSFEWYLVMKGFTQWLSALECSMYNAEAIWVFNKIQILR